MRGIATSLILTNMSAKEEVCSFEHLYNAMNICKKSVDWKDSVAGWVANGAENCFTLQEQLLNGTYKISKYQIFEIFDPKHRKIVSTRFRDRVFQRSLCDNYLTKEVSRHFIYDCAACLKQRGTDFARKRLKVHLMKYYREHGAKGYVLKIDIKNYFGSTRHDVACREISKYIRDEWALRQVCDIINSFNDGENPEVGIGLGSQVSQLIQLAVLNGIDHQIKGRLHIKHYVRYMDDLIIVHEDKEYLQYVKSEIEKELGKLCLKLNTKKTQIFPLSQAIKFLGFSFRLTESGKIIVRILPEKLKRSKRKIKNQVRLAEQGKLPKEKVDECNQARMNHLSKTHSYKLMQDMNIYYKKLWRNNKCLTKL